MESGKLVPDDMILKLVLQEIANMENFLLDGFPRTLFQAEELEKISPIDLVVFFKISEATVVSRLTQRRICPWLRHRGKTKNQ